MRGYLIVPGGFLRVEVRNCDKAGRGGIAVAALHCASAGNQVEVGLQLGKRSSAIGGRCADGAGAMPGCFSSQVVMAFAAASQSLESSRLLRSTPQFSNSGVNL